MLSVETIRQMSRDAAKKAASEGRVPFYFWPNDSLEEQAKDIPYLGTYLPKGWRRVRLSQEFDADRHGIYMGDNAEYGAYFVDSSGFGSEDEPAMSFS